ncbi:MAG: GIY-YIG nuclease family protein [Candidatus Pacebacteria bacterium]|nr:GIY-YIG nuclease family protein [Candidatus Paceibacterota bacterium]
MDIDKLKQLITKTPSGPGIYRFQNEKKEDIYIGKASSIKKRLISYARTTDPRIKKMVASASNLNFTETESDIEALILESQLIKQQRPQFNIMLRDDKQYFYVAFSKDKFPRVSLTHQPSDDFIGPFTEGVAIKATLKYLRDIFPYCTCSQKHHNFCLNYHIGKCIGFCCLNGEQTEEQHKRYLANIKALKEILTGGRSDLVKELKKEMDDAGKKHDFTKAIELRTKLERLERVFYNAQVIKHSDILKSYNSGLTKLLGARKTISRIEGYDISNIQGKHAVGSMVTFVNGLPDKNFYRKFNINTVRGSNDTAMLAEILKRRLNHTEWPFPDLILIDGGKGQVSSALNVLEEMAIVIPVIGLSKDDRHVGHQLIIPGTKQPLSLTKLPEIDKNMLLSIDSEAHRFAISHYRKVHRRSL